MYIKSVSCTENSNTVCVTLSDDATNGIEKFFISKKIFSSLDIPVEPRISVDEEIYEKIKSAADKTSAIREASRLIGNGEKSKKDIIRRLKSKKLPDEAVAYAVKLLEKNGYLDDTASCTRLAQALVSSKHYGRRRITEYLLSHGYDRNAAEEAVESIPREEYKVALLYSIEHKYPNVAGADIKEKQKITAGLMRLGFSFNEIADGIREYIKNN